MTLSDLGNLGEFIGAIAVVISLVYVAIQLRQNTKLVGENTVAHQISSFDENLNKYSAWRRHIIDEPEVAELFLKGLERQDSLSEVEALRWHALVTELIFTVQSVYERANAGHYEYHRNSSVAVLNDYMRYKSMRDAFRSSVSHLLPDFVQAVRRECDFNQLDSIVC